MVSATRLIAAVAIVALGTGTLFLAASPGPSPAVSPSPSPATWTPPPGLITEKVAPGVLLATEDAVGNDLRAQGADFAFAPDGSLWLARVSGFYRVGHEGRSSAPGFPYGFAALEVAPDGTPWALSQRTVASFRDGAWVSAPAFPGGAAAEALAVLPDGTVWAGNDMILARLDGDSWTAFPIEDAVSRITDGGSLSVAWTPDGTIWGATCGPEGDEGLLLRFDGTRMRPVSPPVVSTRCVAPLVSGPDGALWAAFRGLTELPFVLGRYDGAVWDLSQEDARLPLVSKIRGHTGSMVVGHDGRLWATAPGDLGVYDGTTWTSVYVPADGQVLRAGDPMEVAPDGTIWILTEAGLLVVTP